MRFFFRLEEEGKRWTAVCDDLDASGRGATPEEAVAQLRSVIAEHVDRPFAVAPPEDTPAIEIDLVPIDRRSDAMVGLGSDCALRAPSRQGLG